MKTDLVNGAAVAIALVASVLMAAPSRDRAERAGPSIADSGGARVPARAYRRIASGSTVADRLLLELCEPERVIAFTSASADGPDGYRYRSRAHIDRLDDAERIARLAPDLVLLHNVADARRVERLRDAGLNVFDLGSLRGASTIPDDARRVAAFCGAPERAEPWIRAWERRLRSIARHIPSERRKSAAYLALYAGRIFGGTRGSSFHDVLTYAGLRDVAAARFEGWPQYADEQVLALDPDVIVTRRGMGRALCARASMATLRACREHRVLEIDGALLDDPGPGILDAAEAVHAAAYE